MPTRQLKQLEERDTITQKDKNKLERIIKLEKNELIN